MVFPQALEETSFNQKETQTVVGNFTAKQQNAKYIGATGHVHSR